MRKNTLIFPLIVWISAHFPSLCSDSIEREKLCSWCRWTWMAVVAGGEGGFSSVLSATGWLLQFVGILQLAAGIATGLATTDWASERLIKRLTQGISQFHNLPVIVHHLPTNLPACPRYHPILPGRIYCAQIKFGKWVNCQWICNLLPSHADFLPVIIGGGWTG